ncbi:MAG: HAMP domain-containing protein, partial [Marivibrio sp.]|uniref:HAMP domain-containing protein n=1 Tax=Marivibrio sp. TaxID=2039719 RepID=UPI0032EAF3B4
MQFLKRVRIPTKTFGGFAIVLVLLLITGGVGVVGMMKGGGLFAQYRELAAEANASANVAAGMMDTQLAVKTYMITPSPDSAEAVRAEETALLEELTAKRALFNDPAKLAQLDEVEAKISAYKAAFEEAVVRETRRQELVQDTLAALGPELAATLTDIMRGANADDDARAAFEAAQVQERFLLARLYVEKFVTGAAQADFERAVQELEKLDAQASDMLSELRNPARRELARRFLDGEKRYAQALTQVYDAITARNAIIRGELDVIGPQVMEIAYGLKKENQAREAELGARANALLMTLEIVVAVVVVVALGFGAAIAWLIGTGIARPIRAMTDAMKRLAAGDHGVEIPAQDHEDEIGAMAEAVAVFKQNA